MSNQYAKYPNAAAGGGVTTVTATAPIHSSGGSAPNISLNVPLNILAGSAGAPSLTLTGDVTTGIYSGAANEIDLAIAGAKAMSVLANGFGGAALLLSLDPSELYIGALANSPIVTNTFNPPGMLLASALYNPSIISYAANGGIGILTAAGSNGSIAAPTASTSGNQVGIMQFVGYTGSNYRDGASLYAVASSNWTGSTTPMDLHVRSVNWNVSTPAYNDTAVFTHDNKLNLPQLTASTVVALDSSKNLVSSGIGTVSNTQSSTPTNYAGASGDFFDQDTLTLAAGTYILSAMLACYDSTASVTTTFLGISTGAAGNTFTDRADGVNAWNQQLVAASGLETTVGIVSYPLTLGSTTTIRLKVLLAFSAGTPVIQGYRLSAVQISP